MFEHNGTRTFRGVNSAAPIVSKQVQQLKVGLAGREARVALHRLSNSRGAILFGLPQLRALCAILNLEGKMVLQWFSPMSAVTVFP